MNLPDISIIHLIHKMTQSAVCFALYRLPWTDEPILVLSHEGSPEILSRLTELNGKSGFLMAPFVIGKNHPIVLIRPDHIAHEWSAISELLQTWYDEGGKEMLSDTKLGELATTGNISDEAARKTQYLHAFQQFITPLQHNDFQKLVLSRKSEVNLHAGFSPVETFVRACNCYPRMMISLCHTPQTGTWIGSTPEIILSGHQEQWHTVALAGTMPMQGETIPTNWSEKNREEQAFVSEYIRKTLKKFSQKLTEKGPYTARAGQLVHLKTDFQFQLKSTGKLGDILHELHPTPAVCGLPKDKAYSFIPAHEGYDRSYYSGIIGWLDPEGDTTLYVNLRCMHLINGQAELYAGGGILPQSVAETEWEETRQKMNTMHHIIQ